jgi:uncharacterized protein YjbI with pentapeptide repeats
MLAFIKKYLTLIVLILGVFSIYTLTLYLGFQFLPDKKSFVINLYTDFTSFIFSSILIVLILNLFSKNRAITELRERLVRESGSSVNSIAKNAVDQLRKLDWLKSGKSLLAGADLFLANLDSANLSFSDLSKAKLTRAILRNANLTKANIELAKIEQADLENADLEGANLIMTECIGSNFKNADLKVALLSKAILRDADLSNALLIRADLTKCDLTFASLKNAKLLKTDLTEAELCYSNICGADLQDAQLYDANLYGLIYDSKTIFPDGRKYQRNKIRQIASTYGAKIVKPFWE